MLEHGFQNCRVDEDAHGKHVSQIATTHVASPIYSVSLNSVLKDLGIPLVRELEVPLNIYRW
jgi:hypothetical protein